MRSTIKELMEITVFGTGSSTHQMVSYFINEFLKNAQIPYKIKEETDITTFLKKGIMSVPCIQIGNEFLSVSSNGSFNKSLRMAIKHILKKQNFGSMDKIIIPIDFSDVSTNAFMFGHRLATDVKAILKALHVYLPTSKKVSEPSVADVGFLEMRKNILDNYVSNFDKDWTSDIITTAIIDSEFRTGFPGEGILDSVEENAAEMIIMGTTGNSGPIKKWFGSVSTKVIFEAPCPILLVPEKARYKRINNVLFTYDKIEFDKSVIDQLVGFSKRFNAILHLIHINVDNKPNSEYYLLELFKKKYPNQKIHLTSAIDQDVVDTMDKYSEIHDIDIFAIDTTSRSFFDRIFHKSLKKMTVHSELPLLILKPAA